jgi:hypothetical protein
MSRNLSKKCAFVGVIMLVFNLFFIPILPANISQNYPQNHRTELFVEKPVSSGGKPDLIVLNMGFAPYGDDGRRNVAYATIKNIGDVDIQGTLTLKYTFTRLVFGTIAYINTRWMSGGLEPGEEAYWSLIYETELPKFGFFEFKCTVNPGGTIEESNYDNNDLSQDYFVFLGHWKVI